MPEEKELQSIKSLEQELIEQQQLEILMKGDNNSVQRTINAYAGNPLLYTEPERIKEMVEKLRIILRNYTVEANGEGRLLGAKALNKYLTKSEKADITQKKLAAIQLGEDKFLKRRLKISNMELTKFVNVFQSDINIFKARAKVAGFTNKQILNQLVLIGKEGEGAAQELARRLKNVNVAATRADRTAGEIRSYLKVYPPETPYQWIVISIKPCPDCSIRTGKVKSYEEWQTGLGVPNSGRTICNRWGMFCRCKLIPLPIAVRQFPTIKEFEFEPKAGVLTTAKEARALRAKKAQAPQKSVIQKSIIKKAIVKKPIIKEPGIPVKSKGLTPESLIATWVIGSKRKTSVIMKTAAIKEFGLPGVPFSIRKYKIHSGDIAIAQNSVRTLYDQTQKELKKQGVKSVQLFRGVKKQYDKSIVGSLESWTTDRNVSKWFNGKYEIAENIPIERILSYSKSKLWKNGRYGEQLEYIIMPERPKK